MNNLKITIESLAGSIEICPMIRHSSECQFMDFPEIEYSSDMNPIIHTAEMIIPIELIEDEFDINNTLREELKINYYINEINDELVIAKARITEFPSNWKEKIDASWSYWLDAYDGDHLTVGSRADKIEELGLYDDPFDFGSLFYLERLEVHPRFRGSKLGQTVVKRAINYLARNNSGMIFLIANPIENELSDEPNNFKSPKRLAKYYKSIGFNIVEALESKAILMEANISDFL